VNDAHKHDPARLLTVEEDILADRERKEVWPQILRPASTHAGSFRKPPRFGAQFPLSSPRQLVIVLRDSVLHLPATAVRDSPLTPQQLADLVWETMRRSGSAIPRRPKLHRRDRSARLIADCRRSSPGICYGSPTISPASCRPSPEPHR
jgi:hypothetical protein